MPNTTLLQRIELLANELGLSEQEVLSKAIEVGVCVLYRQQIADQYVSGNTDRETVLCELGPHEFARLECVIRQQQAEESDLFCGHA